MAATNPPPDHGLGLALSGGGSRAAAFHRGTLRGLQRTGLLPSVDVVSTVSGGSVFGGAWMAARARQVADEAFLASMADELERGFVLRSLRPRLLRVLLPGYSLTDVIARTFDEVFFEGSPLGQLPDRPRLCLNTSVLDHGQVGKFSKDGFATPDAKAASGDRVIPIPGFRLARAVSASAAFPVGLPPVRLSRKGDLGGAVFSGALAGHEELYLTDGGVLENLGVQTLLRSERFWTWNLVVSDAGAREGSWKPGLLSPLKAAGIALLTRGALDQVMSVMNNKENRWMRERAFLAMEESWLVDALRQGAPGAGPPPGLAELLAERLPHPRRKLLFVRVNQTLGSLVTGTTPWRLVELWTAKHGAPPPKPPPEELAGRLQFLKDAGVDLSAAIALYSEMGGDAAVTRLNAVGTNFTGLSRADIDGFADHAEWQVLAGQALFWS